MSSRPKYSLPRLSDADTSLPLWLLFTIIAICGAWYATQIAIFGGATTFNDGKSYFEAWESIKTLHTDPIRTPVYAIFVGIMAEIFGKEIALIIIPAINWATYVVSLTLIWRIAVMLSVRRGLNIALMLLLALTPGFWLLNNFTMAEPFCLLEILLLIWLTCRYLLNPRRRYLTWFLIIYPLLIFTKPMYIYFMPLIIVLWWVILRKDRKGQIRALCGLAATLLLIAIYLFCNWHTHQVASFTMASSFNKYHIYRADEALLPDDIDDPELRERFRKFYDANRGGWGRINYWGELYYFHWYERVYLTDVAEKKQPDRILEGYATQFRLAARGSCFYTLKLYDVDVSNMYKAYFKGWNGMTFNNRNGFIYPLVDYLWLPMWTFWVVTIIYTAVWIVRWIRSRSLPLIPYFIASITVAGYIVTVTGAMDDWGRIMIPLNPLIPLMAVSLLSDLSRYLKDRKARQIENSAKSRKAENSIKSGDTENDSGNDTVNNSENNAGEDPENGSKNTVSVCLVG